MCVVIEENVAFVNFGHGRVSVGQHSSGTGDYGVVRLTDISHLNYQLGDEVEPETEEGIQKNPIRPVFLVFSGIDSFDVLIESLMNLKRQMQWELREKEKSHLY